MKAICYGLIVLFFAGCQCQKSDPTKPVDFDNAFSIKAELVNKSLTVSVRLENGYHAYGPGESIGKPVDLTIANKNGWRTQGAPILPVGVVKNLGSLGKSVVLTDTFVVTQRLEAGTGPVEGILHLQICTDDVCDRPRQHPFEVTTP